MRPVNEKGAQDTDCNESLRGLELTRPKEMDRDGSFQFCY